MEQFAIVTVDGSFLGKVQAIFSTKEDANSKKDDFPHPFGVFIYPIPDNVKVGDQIKRNAAFE